MSRLPRVCDPEDVVVARGLACRRTTHLARKRYEVSAGDDDEKHGSDCEPRQRSTSACNRRDDQHQDAERHHRFLREVGDSERGAERDVRRPAAHPVRNAHEQRRAGEYAGGDEEIGRQHIRSGLIGEVAAPEEERVREEPPPRDRFAQLREQKFERCERDAVHEERDAVRDGAFGCSGCVKDAIRDREQHRIERTAMRVNRRRPAVREEAIGDVEIRDSVRIHEEALVPRVQRADRDDEAACGEFHLKKSSSIRRCSASPRFSSRTPKYPGNRNPYFARASASSRCQTSR